MRNRRIALIAALLAFAGGCAAGDDADRRLRLPAAFPADLPLPEHSVLRTARDLGSRGLNLVFETGEPMAAVQVRLRERLEAEGWALLSEAAIEGAVFTSYRKGGRSAAFGVSRTGEVTVVGLSYRQSALPRGGDNG